MAQNSKINNNSKSARKQNGKRENITYRKDVADKTSKRNNSKTTSFEKQGVSKELNDTAKVIHNDLNWYHVDAEQERLVSGLSFNTRLGTPITIVPNAPAGSTHASQTYNPAGIMKMYYAPAYGGSTAMDSTINQAGEAIFAYIRSQLRTTANYDSSDIMIYLINVDSLYAEIFQYVRVLLLANKRNFANQYYPRVAVEACGFDYDEIIHDYANLVTQLNFIILDMSTKYVPDLFYFMRRHMYLNANVFRENDRDNSQLYIPIPEVFFRYGVYNVGTQEAPNYQYKLASFANPATIPHPHTGSGKYSLSEALDSLRIRVREFQDNEDFNRMSADMLNAYGPEQGVYMSTINTDMTLEPVKSPEFLLQLHNALAMGSPKFVGDGRGTTDDNDYAILQKVADVGGNARGWLEARYNITGNPTFGNGMDCKYLFDCTYDWSGDSATLIEGTRLAPAAFIGGSNKTVNDPTSEIPTKFAMVTYDVDTGIVNELEFHTYVTSTEFTPEFIQQYSSFKYAPIIYRADSDDTGRKVFGSTELWTVTDYKFRFNINKYCTYGLFRVDLLRQGKTLKSGD